jgi:GDP-L-fucose synthase
MTNPHAYSLAGKRIWVAGHRGMVGSAIVRRLAEENCIVLTAARSELDLLDQAAVAGWIVKNRPQAIFLAAAKVGGILANTSFPAEILHQNLAIATNIIEAAHRSAAEKLLFLGSSCIYPRLARQPIREDELLTLIHN